MEERTYKKKKRGERDRKEGKIHSLLTILSPGTTLRVIRSMRKVRKGKKIDEGGDLSSQGEGAMPPSQAADELREAMAVLKKSDQRDNVVYWYLIQ